jgi:hypothetical protein
MNEAPETKYDDEDIDEAPSLEEFEQEENVNPPVVFAEINGPELAQCKVGTEITLWTKDDYEFINGYREGTANGAGKVFSLRKEENLHIAECIELGIPAWVVVTEVQNGEDGEYVLEFKVDRDALKK